MNIGWILGSMILVSGGFIMSTIAMGIIGLDNPYIALVFWGAGAFVAGFIAARASAGKTIIEPALGSVAFVAAIVISFLATPLGTIMSAAVDFLGAEGEMAKTLGIIGASFLGGGIGGAYLGERTQDKEGEITGGLLIFLSFLMILGGLFLGLFISMMTAIGSAGSLDELVNMVILGLAIGAFVGGLASGRAGATTGSIALGAFLSGTLFIILGLSGDSESGAAGGAVVTVVILILSLIGGFIGRKLRGSSE